MGITENMHLNKTIDIGEMVICDVCGSDFSDSEESGGFLFGSYAYCPNCATPENLERIRSYGEEKYITAYCPAGTSFKDWVVSLRGGDNTIKFYSDKK